MTHNAKACVERPRKIGAKWTGTSIQADEVLQDINLDYDGKRDRWNGYDNSTYDKVMDQYQQTEAERRKKKKEEEMNNFATEPDATHDKFPHTTKEAKKKTGELVSDDSDSDSDLEKEDDFLDTTEAIIGQKRDTKTRTTVRNLRIREDTAKYLRNLDIDSAYYDPKSRSMREDPNPQGKGDKLYVGDNFVRQSGESKKFLDVQMYAWQSNDLIGQDLHLQAAPSQAELTFREFNTKKESLTKKNREAIMEKYGGVENADSSHLLLAQTEEYVEYTQDGTLPASKFKKAIPKSKYEEDVFPSNHKSVWGSYWENGQWGFACCHQFLKMSYCTGRAGISAQEDLNKERSAFSYNSTTSEDTSKESPLKKSNEKIVFQSSKKSKKDKDSGKTSSENQSEEKDERKRGYNSFNHKDYEVTDEQMEAYQLKKKRFDDPMKNFIDS